MHCLNQGGPNRDVIFCGPLSNFTQFKFCRLRAAANFYNKAWRAYGTKSRGCHQGHRKRGEGGAIAPCLLTFLKRGGRGGRLCSLKLVLQIKIFKLYSTINLYNLNPTMFVKFPKTTVTYSTAIKARFLTYTT